MTKIYVPVHKRNSMKEMEVEYNKTRDFDETQKTPQMMNSHIIDWKTASEVRKPIEV